MQILTIQIECAPTKSPWRVQIDCGMISPAIKISSVETNSPTAPEVRSAMRMEMAELMTVFPSSRVQSSKFPCFRTGRILRAYSRSFPSPACSRMLRAVTSRPKRPMVNPANKAVTGTSAKASERLKATLRLLSSLNAAKSSKSHLFNGLLIGHIVFEGCSFTSVGYVSVSMKKALEPRFQ
jgi:hypothetical protein